jgi:uncharacterized membrane protein YfcA
MELTQPMWLLAIFCAFMIGMAKTGISGLGTVIIPLMAYIFGGMPSSGIVLPMLIMADTIGVIYYHRSANWKTILRIMPWALVGIAVGLAVGKSISPDWFRRLIGILVLLSLAIMLWLEYRRNKIEQTVTGKKAYTIIFGLLGGFSTMIGNAAGPVMSVYLLSENMDKKEFIGTAAWFFFIINILKMPLQIWGWHNITWQTFQFDLMLLPAIALGAWAGISIIKMIPERIYRWFIWVATIISAVVLF